MLEWLRAWWNRVALAEPDFTAEVTARLVADPLFGIAALNRQVLALQATIAKLIGRIEALERGGDILDDIDDDSYDSHSEYDELCDDCGCWVDECECDADKRDDGVDARYCVRCCQHVTDCKCPYRASDDGGSAGKPPAAFSVPLEDDSNG